MQPRYKLTERVLPQINLMVSTETKGPIDLVFALLKGSTTWPKWSPVRSCTMKAQGRNEPHGVGAIRVFRTGLIAVTEEIVEVSKDRRIAYVLKAGLPLKGYRAFIDLTPRMDGGTIIVWQASFQPVIPFTGWYYKRLIEAALKDTVRRLGRTAANKEVAARILAQAKL